MVTFWAILKYITFQVKVTVANKSFLDDFTKIWATFYFNIWSHWTWDRERETERERERERERDRECSATNVFNCEKVFPSRRIPA